MPPKSASLAILAHSLQAFVADRSAQDLDYMAVERELQKISNALQNSQLTLQIVSQNSLAQAQLLQQVLLNNRELASAYKFKTTAIPQITDINTQLFNSNILCLIIPLQPLSDDAQSLLEIARESEISRFFIIVEKPRNSELIQPIDSSLVLSQIERSVKYCLLGSPFGIVSLQLDNLHSIINRADSNFPSELEQFCNGLRNLARGGTETILAEWFVRSLAPLFTQIEMLLIKKDSLDQKDLLGDELCPEEFKKQLEKIYRSLTLEREVFFKQIRIKLNQSKANLLDEFKKTSIGYKVEKFTDQLEPKVITKGDHRNIFLHLPGRYDTTREVHDALVSICHIEISQWATVEWERIHKEYVNGGLNALYSNSYRELNLIPKIMVSKKEFSSSQILSIQTVLNISSVDPENESQYKQMSFWEYLLIKSKDHVVGSITLTVLATFLLKGADKLGGSSAGAAGIDVRLYLLLFLIPFAIVVLRIYYNKDKEAKLKETTQKLRQESVIYYQSYTKWLVEKLIQRIGILMEGDERNLRDILDNVKDIYHSHINEIIQEKQLKQNKIDRDLAELRKLRQSL
jgi:hypothetical protein